MENPEPTETEQELQITRRHRDEEDMRGVGQDDDLPIDDQPDADGRGGRPDGGGD